MAVPMTRVAWLTDLHLNFADEPAISTLVRDVETADPQVVLIGGDTGEAPTFVSYLEDLAARLDRPLYFVLGNHDYYRGSIQEVREQARRLTQRNPLVRWLPDVGIVPLSESTALIGHGGWGDGRCGSFLDSDILLNDYLLIQELLVELELDCPNAPPRSCRNLKRLEKLLNQLGDEAADHLRNVLPEALDRFESLLVLMHVPPFRDACWHEGRHSDLNWAPHFTCIAAGEVLREAMEQRPDRRMTVLCGHTHSPGVANILPNLEVLTGEAEYCNPKVQRVLEVG